MSSSRPLKKRNLLEWWKDFCDSASRAWNSFKVKAHITELPLATMDELNEARENSTNTSRVYETSSESDNDLRDVAPTLVRQDTYSRVTQSTSESTQKDATPVSVDDELHHSPAALAAAQQSESEKDTMPANMFRTGIAFLAVAGVLSLAALYTGIYPIFGIAGMLAVIGTALMLTAYFANDVEKNGTLTSQVFPPNPTSSFLPASGHIGYGI